MNLAFTLCSLNYMHLALTLGKSLLKTNPDYKFVIGLVDQVNEKVDRGLFDPFEVIEVDRVMPPSLLKDMSKRYNVVELNTAVKPFYFEHLFNHYQAEYVTYFDPDMMVFNRLSAIEKIFAEGGNLILTPHAVTPKEEGNIRDFSFIKVGIFNLGFISMRNTETCANLLKWWQRRLIRSCYLNSLVGLYVDQLWMNLSVCYADKTHVLKDLGYNMAPWNLHERRLSKIDGVEYVNKEAPLILFHFSQISEKNTFLTEHEPELTFENRPDLKDVHDLYKKQLDLNGKEFFQNIPCEYSRKKLRFRIYLSRIAAILSLKYLRLYEKV